MRIEKPADFQQLDIPFESPGTRLGHLQETIQLLKQLLTEEMVNFNGKYYTITEMRGYLRPVQIPKRSLSTEQAIAELMEMRDRYGFSYFQVYVGQMENFAALVAGMRGR